MGRWSMRYLVPLWADRRRKADLWSRRTHFPLTPTQGGQQQPDYPGIIQTQRQVIGPHVGVIRLVEVVAAAGIRWQGETRCGALST
jgi:hypothetical protein